MKRIPLLLAALLMCSAATMAQGRKMAAAGVAFYNLENLFDTIPNNPENRDAEFTPAGSRQWNGVKYWNKIHNLAYAISQMTSKITPMGPAVLGVSEIENKSVLDDLVADPQIAAWNLQVVHHDSPDARGVDVGLLYNPKYFFLENVTNHRLTAVKFRTRDQMCVVGRLLGEPMAFIVNHWPSRLGGQEKSSPSREAAAALSKAIADSLWAINPDMGVIIMGDLNDDPMDKSCAKVLGAKRKKTVLTLTASSIPGGRCSTKASAPSPTNRRGTSSTRLSSPATSSTPPTTAGISSAPKCSTASSLKTPKATARAILAAHSRPACTSTAIPTTSLPRYSS